MEVREINFAPGKYMEIILSLLTYAAIAFVKVFAKALAHYIVKRVKDKAALTANKDDSNDK